MNAASRAGRRGSRARCGLAACPAPAGRSGPRGGARGASPWPCTPASRPRRSTAPGRCGCESTASRVRSSGACRATSSSKVRFGSSIIAHSSPSTGASTGAPRRRAPSRPSACASRRAGSIVSTATFFPRAAMPRAIGRGGGRLAHAARARRTTHTSLPLEPALDHSRRSNTRESRSSCSAPISGSNRWGRVITARVGGPPQPAPLRPLGARAAVLGQRGARGRAGLRGARRRPAPRAGAHPPRVKRWGSTEFRTIACKFTPSSSRQPLLELDRLVHRDLLRQRHGEHARGGRVAHELVDDQGLAADRPDPGHARVGGRARGASRARGRWPGRPRSPGRTPRPRCGARAGRGPRSCPSSPAR